MASSVWFFVPESVSFFLHLLCTAVVVGVMLWHTFFSGPVSFKSMKRTAFGVLQGKLFPFYFSVLTVAHAGCFLTANTLKPSGNSEKTVASALQADSLALLFCLVMNVTNQFGIGPRVTSLMHERHPYLAAIEAASAPGADPALAEAVKKDAPAFAAVNKRFGALHGVSSLINLVQFIGTAIELIHALHRCSLSACRCVCSDDCARRVSQQHLAHLIERRRRALLHVTFLYSEF